MKNSQIITFTLEDGTDAQFEVLEETKINGVNYLLVVDTQDEETAIILREDTTDEQDIIYTPVEDDNQLQALSKVFSELLEDIEFEK